MTAPVRVGVLGCGIVGAALVDLLAEETDAIAERVGVRLEISRVAVRDLAKDRPVELAGRLTDDPMAVVSDPDVDVVVELIGGVDPARQLVVAALEKGKPVVTANKELLASHGAELFEAAHEAGVDLLFEAAVAGAIPLMRPLRESLVGEPIWRVMGIVNGTTNYILSQMTDHGVSYDAALADAQARGFAESDPTADVEGFDAAAKAAVIATVAFGAHVVADDVSREGITTIDADDIEVARRLGYVIKLLAIAERVDEDESHIAVRVHPAMVPAAHPLAAVRDSFNAVFVEGGAVDELMLYGRGAGGRPTASAVLGDLIDASTNLRRGASAHLGHLGRADVAPIDELESPYYLNVDVVDRPGVLATVAGVFGTHGVSIRSMEQEGLGDEARLFFITHTARERDLRATIDGLRGLDVVDRINSVVRVIESPP